MQHPIPNAALDDRLAIVGTSGSGKTYGAGTAVERLLTSGARVLIIDPLGVWWGLGLTADGKKPSTFRDKEKLILFGGEHGDMPLLPQSGALMGETIAGMAESCILDLSDMASDAEQRRFVLALLQSLFKHKARDLLHVVIDEADMWAPQLILDKDGEAPKLLGVMQKIVKRGRVFGFIPWLITQNPAGIAKSVLGQVTGLISFSLTSSQDRDAIGAWVKGQADEAQWKSIWGTMPTLPTGRALTWLPRRDKFKIEDFPAKVTFDSSRAPKRGERVKAKKLKPINLDKLQERLAAVDAEIKASDPKALKAENAKLRSEKSQLERQLDAVATAKPNPKAAAHHQKIITSLRTALEAAMKFIVQINANDFFDAGGKKVDQKAIEKAITDATAHVTKLIEANLAGRDKRIAALQGEAERLAKQLNAVLNQKDSDVLVAVNVTHNKPFSITPTARPISAPAKIARSTSSGDGGSLPVGERACLIAIAQHHDGVTRQQLTVLTGYKKSTRDAYIARLRERGLIEIAGARVVANASGIEAIGSDYEPLPTGDALRSHVLSRLPDGERRVLEVLIAAHPEQVERADIDATTGFKKSTRDAYLARLNARELIEAVGRGAVKASEDLFG